jgi:chromate transporter
VLVGASHFDRLRDNARARAFLNGAGPAAIGAIVGVAIPLGLALQQPWQLAILAAAAIALLPFRRPVVLTLIAAGIVGAVAAQLGAPLP